MPKALHQALNKIKYFRKDNGIQLSFPELLGCVAYSLGNGFFTFFHKFQFPPQGNLKFYMLAKQPFSFSRPLNF